jgi:alpha-amylase
MVSFRKATAGVPQVTDWWDDGSNQIAFGRGKLGFVVINREAAPLTRAFQTSLPAGSYCDVVAGERSAGTCTGATIMVDSSGTAQITAPAGAAVAIHAGAML